MTWDNPWFVGQPAKHSAQIARTFAFVATGGAAGIAQPSDCKVVATAVPSDTLLVSAGGLLIPSRGADSYEQSYISSNREPDPVKPAATGSTGGRRDLIVGRVEDINAAGGAQWKNNGADPATGPFMFSRIIENVPAGTKTLQEVSGHESDVGEALALITIPANTATFTNAMITDLRRLARPRETTVELFDPGTAKATLSATAGTVFPPFTPDVPVPDWATHVRITLTIAQLAALGNSTGGGNVQGRDTSGATIVDGDSVAFNFDAVVTSTRGVYIASTYGDVRALRGKTLRPTSLMRKNAGQANLQYDEGSQMTYRVTFYEKPV